MRDLELLRKVGRPEPSEAIQRDLVLLFLGSQHMRLESLLRSEGFTVVVPFKADQAVALCLHNRSRIAAAIIDETSALEVEEWSLARSLKAVCPNTPIVLVVHGLQPERRDLAEGVDCVVSDAEPQQVLEVLRRCLPAESEQAG
jgi:hypothetical protein